jgi:hypothetical protein
MTLDHLLLAEMNVLQERHAEALALYDTYCRVRGRWLPARTAAMSDRGHCCLAMGRVDEDRAAATALHRVDESTPHIAQSPSNWLRHSTDSVVPRRLSNIG